MRLFCFGDLHIGSIKDTNYVYSVITEIFDKELQYQKTDAVMILGDYFHRLLKVNENYTLLAMDIMSYLVTICKKNKIKVRIIYGTESHDSGQYLLFNEYQKQLDFKVIYTVTEEELFPGVNVLYIPEEYMYSKEEHYKDYLYSGKHYDYIFGHGVIVEGMPMVQFSKQSSEEKHIPYFKSGELAKVSKICLFNHYHVHTDLGDGVYYIGSLFRDSFGEEEAKVYAVINGSEVVFVENREAYLFKTYEFKEDDNVYQSKEALVATIKDIKIEHADIFSGERYGRIRLKFNLPHNIDDSFKENLRNILINDKNISILLKESNIDLDEIKESIETEYDFILDSSLDITDKIHQYIQKKYDVGLTMDELIHYIKDDFKV
nr:MAG TPA: DNA repair exonuclease [Caudoviricetes sp.]